MGTNGIPLDSNGTPIELNNVTTDLNTITALNAYCSDKSSALVITTQFSSKEDISSSLETDL
jgi:hypothetical protein